MTRLPDAFAKVVDRLLASPRYGERWGRYWLDVARYSDDKLNSTQEEPHPNAFRYRDWVIGAFNKDMPYDLFVKAQIAGDMLESPDPLQYLPGLGYYALSPEMQDERVDATTRGFLGLTVACAQCHNHKYDPIPQKDYYSLQGVFSSSELNKVPLAPKDVVEKWDAEKKAIDKLETKLKDFVAAQTDQLGGILASQTARFLLASRKLAPADDLDVETLERWSKYLESPKKEHPYLNRWFELAAKGATREEFEAAAREFQAKVEEVNEEKHLVDEKNKIKLGLDPTRNDMSQADCSRCPSRSTISGAICSPRRAAMRAAPARLPPACITTAAPRSTASWAANGSGNWSRCAKNWPIRRRRCRRSILFSRPSRTTRRRATFASPFAAITTTAGDVAPRHLPSILCEAAPKPFTKGSGRLELAEGIADPGQSADRARHGEPHLAAPFRTGHRGDAE